MVDRAMATYSKKSIMKEAYAYVSFVGNDSANKLIQG